MMLLRIQHILLRLSAVGTTKHGCRKRQTVNYFRCCCQWQP